MKSRRVTSTPRAPRGGPSAPSDRSSTWQSIEAWFAARSRWVLLALVVASIGVRAVYLVQLAAGPCIELHRLDQSDMHYYEEWGRQIAHGDWASASVTVPVHGWQHRVAERYLASHPDVRASLEIESGRPGAPRDLDLLLWSRWMGGHQFYQDPLYPYLVGLTYRMFGENVRAVFAWQMLLGVFSNVLVWLLARRAFGDLVAAVAGALAVLCAPVVYYELIMLRETTIVCAGLALAWVAERALGGRWPWFVALGAGLGLACELKSSFALLGLGLAAGILIAHRHRLRDLRVPALAAALGLAVAVAPLAARNLSVGVSPFALASSGGLTFMISNDVTFQPERGFYIDVPRLTDLMGESGGAMLPAMAATLRAHTVGSYLTLLVEKWDRAWHWVEIPNNDSFYYMRLRAPVLEWLPVTFWLCGPLALVGLVLGAMGAARSPRVWVLYVLAASSLLPLLVFYTIGRFRAPLTASLMPFAALTLVECARWVSCRRYRAAAVAVAAVVLVGAWTGRSWDGEPLIRPADWTTPFAVRYEARVQAALDARDPAKAAAAFLEFFQYEPDPSQLQLPADRPVAELLTRMHADTSSLLRDVGRSSDADAQARRAAVFAQLLGRPASSIR